MRGSFRYPGLDEAMGCSGEGKMYSLTSKVRVRCVEDQLMNDIEMVRDSWKSASEVCELERWSQKHVRC